MSTERNKRQPLLRYWTTRYLLTLFIGLLLIGVLSTVWIRRNAAQRRLVSLKALANITAERVVSPEGTLQIEPNLTGEIERSQRLLSLEPDLYLFIVNLENRIVYSIPGLPPLEILQNITIPPYLEEGLQQLRSGPQSRFYILKKIIKAEARWLGAVYIIHPYRQINTSPDELDFLFFMLGSLAVLGWIIIYLLTRHLTTPIQKVAKAAQQIVEGNYDLLLNSNVPADEIHELIRAFKDMAARLRQLETLRTELLAGVTHELKTPIAAIKGLLQAVQDEVVTGEEAKEFLTICAKETARLQKMVEDLLDFNSFVTGDLRVEKSLCNLNALIREISDQWLLGQEEGSVTVTIQLPKEDVKIATDPLRIRQILYNLLNNAKQALTTGGKIELTLDKTPEAIRIDVKDNGTGIPPAEQALIFERFFRGKTKKDRVRGMGLGLPFSKMIAQALGGDLYLQSTSAQGTTFSLILEPSVNNQFRHTADILLW